MVTCKSENPSRITDNVQIFNFILSDDQMKRLNALDGGFKVTPSSLKTPEERQRYYEDMP
jgi:diketogulonate reductase-like aldo/keto reductase